MWSLVSLTLLAFTAVMILRFGEAHEMKPRVVRVRARRRP